MSTLLAIGAHIGDMELTAGPLLSEAVLAGHRGVILALTPGERGHPRMTPAAYKAQKIAEAESFAKTVGTEFRVFDDQSDGFLGIGDDVALRVGEVIRELRPDVVLAHWKGSFHSDHVNAAILAERGQFLAGIPLDDVDTPVYGVPRLLHPENWEDMDGFEPNVYAEISDEAFSAWSTAMSGHAFARGETYGFRYNDYYTALMTSRGCLAGMPRACAFMEPGRPADRELLASL